MLPRFANQSQPPREYAVLLPLIHIGGEESVLLTVRSKNLPRHAGEISLPGGGREPEDKNLESTALRESYEEVGLPPNQVKIFAELSWSNTTKGTRVKPFVGQVEGEFTPQINPSEVQEIFYIPSKILKEDPFSVRGVYQAPNGTHHSIYTFLYEGYEIWGLTARILREYFNIY